MAHLKQYSYPGLGEWAKENMHYSQAIRVGDRIICAGQGGFDATNLEPDFENLISKNLDEEIDQAFATVDHNLKHAGGKGWEQVYKVVTYSTDIRAQHERIVFNLKKWCPDHCPVWTELCITQLGLDAMHIEIDVEAHDEEGAAKAKKA